MGWCDPCAADPLSVEQLRKLGLFWLDNLSSRGAAHDVFVTRLHVRYDRERFPEDLVFQETGDRTNFQGRYVMRHPWRGGERCSTADEYRRSMPGRFEHETQILVHLTGWDVEEIRGRMGRDAELPREVELSWWRKVRGKE